MAPWTKIVAWVVLGSLVLGALAMAAAGLGG